MIGAIIGPIAAGLIGIILSYIEVYNKRGSMPRRAVWRWVILRLATDGSVSAAAYPLGIAIVSGQQWWIAAIAAGVGAPVILRTQVKFVGKGGNARDFGPEVLYRKIRDFTDVKIDKMASAVDSAWVVDELAPAMAQVPVDRFSAKIENYFKLLERGTSGSSKKTEVTYISDRLKDLERTPQADRAAIYEAIAVQLIAFGHRDLIDGLLKDKTLLPRADGNELALENDGPPTAQAAREAT